MSQRRIDFKLILLNQGSEEKIGTKNKYHTYKYKK